MEHSAVSQRLIPPWAVLATPHPPASIVVKRGPAAAVVAAVAEKAVPAGINTAKEGGDMGIASGMEKDIAMVTERGTVTERGIGIPAVADTARAVMGVKGGEIARGGKRVPGMVMEKERAHVNGKTAEKRAPEMQEKAGRRAHETETVAGRDPEMMEKVKHLLYRIPPSARRAGGTVKFPDGDLLVSPEPYIFVLVFFFFLLASSGHEVPN